MHLKYSIKDIQQQSENFDKCFYEICTELRIINMIDEWKTICDVYVFSGLIRDFFIGGYQKTKDLDIVVTDIDRCMQIINYPHIINKYGGIKININGYNLDVWQLDKTFGIIETHSEPTPTNLIQTAFFNYSAITYDCNKKCLIVADAFVEFMNDRVIDFVYKSNPHPELCIICAAHYAKKYDLNVSDRLKEWANDKIKNLEMDLIKSQKEHFGYVEFSVKEIHDFFIIH